VRPLPAETIRAKRDGQALSGAQIDDFAHGLANVETGGWSDAQAAALAMAIFWRGMSRDETVALTRAFVASGEVLRWDAELGLKGPVLDKHSTGGVGDKVSLMLAPMLAACGAVVPMISGRGLGHTGGTLDKLEALPGYRVLPERETLLAALKAAGCAIVGASADLAPADKRLYAIRDVTATVESLPLITASILSKKLAAGLQALVLDVKVGNGAFMPDEARARALAHSLVEVAAGAGLKAVALLTDMDQVLGTSAGNALELREAVRFLRGDEREPRLLGVTLQLGAEALRLAGLVHSADEGRAHLQAALDGGAAAERFERMVAALGGPADALRFVPEPAPVVREVPAPRAGWVGAIDVRALGLAVVALGGGRRVPGQALDLRVGLDAVRARGDALSAGEPLAFVHAASADAADAAAAAVQRAFTLADAPPTVPTLLRGRVG
jgi:thymidine phosphorylase